MAFTLAYRAGLLLVTNVICINLAGVVTFLAQGIRPLTWWDTGKARRATWSAVCVWAVLLLALMVVIHMSHAV